MLREGNFRVLISEQFIEERDQGDPFTELGGNFSFFAATGTLPLPCHSLTTNPVPRTLEPCRSAAF